MRMKNFIFLAGSTVFILLSAMMTSCSKSESGPDIENAKVIVKAIGDYSLNEYGWLTAEEVQALKPGALRDSLGKTVEYIDYLTDYAASDWRAKGERVGINWDDVKVDSVMVTNDAKASEALGCNVSQGFFILASGGKKYKICFEQAIRLDSVSPWKTIALTTFEPLDKNAKIPSSAEMKQKGNEDYDHILFSLDDRIKDFKELMTKDLKEPDDSLMLNIINLYEDEIIDFVYHDPALALEYLKTIRTFLDENKESIANGVGTHTKVWAKIQNILSTDPAEYVKATAKNAGITVDDDDFNGKKVESKYRFWRVDI